MSIYIFQDNAKALIAKVEGSQWLEHQEQFGGTRNGFDYVLKEWREIDDSAIADDKLQDWYKSETVSNTIYGAGGWNRYIVKYDGEIIFSRYHSTASRIKDAENAGFTAG